MGERTLSTLAIPRDTAIFAEMAAAAEDCHMISRSVEAWYELLMLGDLWGLEQQAKQLIEIDQGYVPIVKQEVDLAQGFQEQQLLQLVETHLATTPPVNN